MTRPVIRRAAACLAAAAVTATTVTLTPASPAQATPRAAPAELSPLAVSLETMTPSTLPRRGRITLTGEVTNRSEDTWTDLQVYLFHSETPITSRAGLAQAADSDPVTDVGPRVTDEGLFDEIGDLAPGESTSYVVSVPVRSLELPDDPEPGIYWLGTHVLGAVEGIRPGVAAGRARTFMPLVDRGGPSTELALLLPLRERVRRGANGSLLGVRQWSRWIGAEGRLGRLVDFADDAPAGVTWLLDPAVLDAVRSVAADDPPFDTGDDGTGPAPGDEEPSDTSSPSPTVTGAGDEGGDDDSGDTAEEPSPEAEQAAAWLETFLAGAADDAVMALPYGDLDVAAVSGNRLDDILERAKRLSADTTAGLGLDAEPVVAPPRGFLPARALGSLDPDTAVVMTDRAFPGLLAGQVVRPDGTEVVLSDSEAGSGGPGPGRRTALLAMRQRVLSDAALHAMSAQGDGPLVVALPTRFDPGAEWQTTGFFEGLDVPWLRQVGLDDVLTGDAPALTRRRPLYPAGQRAAQVPLGNQLASQELAGLGRVYAELLTRNDSIADQLAKAGLLAASYLVRDRPGAAMDRARRTAERVRRNLQKVVVDGPAFVSMTNAVGPIIVTVENRLDEPVTVRLDVETPRDDLQISVPDPITLGPGQRTPVRMRANATTIGVHSVTLVAATEEGTPLGGRDQFSVRSSNVGDVIWLVMGAGFAILALAIVVRLFRRIRAYRARRSEPADSPA